MNLEQKISELQERNKGKLDNAEIPELWAEDTYKALYLFLDQITTTSYQAGVRDAIEVVGKAKAKIEEIEEPVANGCIYKSYVYEILDEALSALIKE